MRFDISAKVEPVVVVSPIDKLNGLLQSLQNKLPPHTFWNGSKAPLLVIDEANELHALTKDPNGQDALHNLFKWLVINTKELNRFHIMLSSSNSFFHLWTSQYIGSSRYETYVIGNLEKDEAQKFWEKLLNEKSVDASKHALPEFDVVYRICGGNMFLLRRALYFLLLEHCTQNNVKWLLFPHVAQERHKLIWAYYQSGKSRLHDKSEPLWNRNDLVYVMKQLVSPPGFVGYEDLCDKLGALVTDSLIEHNIIHLHPTRRCSYDLPIRDDVPVVTAQSACGIFAMEHLLKSLDK